MTAQADAIFQKVMLPASPEVVYDMLMDPVQHASFTGAAASGSSEEGGTFNACDGYIVARNIELERGQRIVQEWSTRGWPADLPPSRLEILLKAVGQGTHLVLVHTGLPAGRTEEYAQGWYDRYWNPLFEHLRERSVKRLR